MGWENGMDDNPRSKFSDTVCGGVGALATSGALWMMFTTINNIHKIKTIRKSTEDVTGHNLYQHKSRQGSLGHAPSPPRLHLCTGRFTNYVCSIQWQIWYLHASPPPRLWQQGQITTKITLSAFMQSELPIFPLFTGDNFSSAGWSDLWSGTECRDWAL